MNSEPARPVNAVLRFGRTPIPYRLTSAGRRRTVSIAVDPEEGVLVRAPVEIAAGKVEDVLRRRAPWILGHLRRQAAAAAPRVEREFVSGETWSYLGRSYRLVVETGPRGVRSRPSAPKRHGGSDPKGRGPTTSTAAASGFRAGPDVEVALRGGRLVVTVGASVAAANRTEVVRRGLRDWYRSRAELWLPERLAGWSERSGLRAAEVLIRSQRGRWASCDRGGVLRLNWRIVQADPRLIDYVLAHELLHLRHPEHSKAFWRELGRLMPEYEKRREELRRVGRGLVW